MGKLNSMLRLLEKRAKPPLSFQTKTSTSEVTNRKPTAGTIRSVIFTLKCTETSCKKRKYNKNNNNNFSLPTNYFLLLITSSFLLDFWILFGFINFDLDFKRFFKDFLKDFHGLINKF